MGKIVREKPIEYKETEVFELFPQYEYTKQQKARLILFHDYANHAKRIINYAAHFDKPNQICVVYIVGEVADEKIQAMLGAAQCSDRVWVLTSAFPMEELNFWKEFDTKRQNLQSNSMWDDSVQDLNERWRSLHESFLVLRKLDMSDTQRIDGQVGIGAFNFAPDWAVKANLEELRKSEELIAQIKHYKQLVKKSVSFFRRWTLHRALEKPIPFQHKDIDKLVSRIYPHSIEANKVNTYGSISPAAMKSAVEMAQTGIRNNRFNFAVNPKYKMVKEISAFINGEIVKNGYCGFEEIERFVKSPPYGMGENGYSAAYLASAILACQGKFYHDSVCDFQVADSLVEIVSQILSRRSYIPVRKAVFENSYIFAECDAHSAVRDALHRLYGVDKSFVAGRVVNYARCVIEEAFRLPLSVTDDLLYRLTAPDLNWFDRAQVEKLAHDLECVGVEQLISVLNFHKESAEKLEAKNLAESAGWLWNRKSVLDSPFAFATKEEDAEERRLFWDDDTLKSQLGAVESKIRRAYHVRKMIDGNFYRVCGEPVEEPISDEQLKILEAKKAVLAEKRSKSLKAYREYVRSLKEKCVERMLEFEEKANKLRMVRQPD